MSNGRMLITIYWSVCILAHPTPIPRLPSQQCHPEKGQPTQWFLIHH